MTVDMTRYMDSQEYTDYMIRNCGVSGFDSLPKSEKSTRPDADIVVAYLDWLGIVPGDEVLEVGCGLGRVLKVIHDRFRVRPTGADRSDRFIGLARERVGAIVTDLLCCPAEALAVPDGRFDRVVCWGTFDLCDQTATLRELARVMAPGGRLLLTAKNNHFEDDDEEAFLAEQASVRLAYPNHYTDTDALFSWAAALGLRVEKARYFRRRGDFAAGQHTDDRPVRFYEYAFILVRDRVIDPLPEHGPLLGLDHSHGYEAWKAGRALAAG